jgi:hypothetical protein
MTPKKTTPLVLMIFTVMCALPVAAGAVPAAIAQEEQTTSLEEDLASGIVSDVLDGGSDDENDNEENDSDAAGGDTNTQVTAPITDQDQTTADIAANRAANLDLEVVREQLPTPTPPEEEEPPEFVAFCLEITNPEEEVNSFILCFDTSEECAEAQEFLEDQGFVISMECEGVETFPPGADECFVSRDNQGEIVAVVCP